MQVMWISGIILGISSLLAAGYGRVLGNVGPYQLPSFPSFITANPIVSFIIGLNPFILIVLGVVVFFAGKFAKFVGVVIVILGLVSLLFPYLLKVV